MELKVKFNNDVTSEITHVISNIVAFDDIEQNHIKDTLSWIDSGAPIFRTKKPDIPNQHLVAYFVLWDKAKMKILLVDHKKAQLWLPTGGHVESDENPIETVRRECREELGLNAEFWSNYPLFLTSTQTVGLTAGHIDVSLWYVLKGDSQASIDFDRDEFHVVRWFDIEDIPYAKSDPHMRRFIRKLLARDNNVF